MRDTRRDWRNSADLLRRPIAAIRRDGGRIYSIFRLSPSAWGGIALTAISAALAGLGVPYPVWLATLGIGLLAGGMAVKGQLTIAHALDYGLRPGDLILSPRISQSRGPVDIEVVLVSRNATDMAMRYRAGWFTVCTDDIESPLTGAPDAVIPARGETRFRRDPIPITTVPAEVMVDWCFYYGRERKRFRFERSVDALMAAPLPDVEHAPAYTKIPITTSERRQLVDRSLTRAERHQLLGDRQGARLREPTSELCEDRQIGMESDTIQSSDSEGE